MTPAEQIVFVHELTDNITADICNKIVAGKVPETWDGHELRQWLVDKFTESATLAKDGRPRAEKLQRYREYLQAVIEHNL